MVNIKNIMLYKVTEAIIIVYINSVIKVKWLWNNDYVKTQPLPSDHLFYLFIWLL